MFILWLSRTTAIAHCSQTTISRTFPGFPRAWWFPWFFLQKRSHSPLDGIYSRSDPSKYSTSPLSDTIYGLARLKIRAADTWTIGLLYGKTVASVALRRNWTGLNAEHWITHRTREQRTQQTEPNSKQLALLGANDFIDVSQRTVKHSYHRLTTSIWLRRRRQRYLKYMQARPRASPPGIS